MYKSGKESCIEEFGEDFIQVQSSNDISRKINNVILSQDKNTHIFTLMPQVLAQYILEYVFIMIKAFPK